MSELDEDRVFEARYPALTRWVQGAGWLEVGRVSWSPALIRALDDGGMVWEGGGAAPTLSAALAEAEDALARVFREDLDPH